MTIIRVEKEIYTTDGNVSVAAECLTDDLGMVTSGKIACILNSNLLVDIQEVTNGKNTFNFNISGHLQKNREHMLRLHYSGSTQADRKTVSSVIFFDKKYTQNIEAEVIAEDYCTDRNKTFKFTSHISLPDETPVEGKAVLKLNNKTLDQTDIVDNGAEIEFKVPNMILDEHVMFWIYLTNHGTYAASSILHLSPRIPVVSMEYHENRGVSDNIRQILKDSGEDSTSDSENTIIGKVKKIFGG